MNIMYNKNKSKAVIIDFGLVQFTNLHKVACGTGDITDCTILLFI